jgi:hypothetical protein
MLCERMEAVRPHTNPRLWFALLEALLDDNIAGPLQRIEMRRRFPSVAPTGALSRINSMTAPFGANVLSAAMVFNRIAR